MAMEARHTGIVAEILQLAPRQVSAVAGLIQDGATVPFISRYRKEATGSLDEVAVTAIRDHLKRLGELDARKAAILKSLAQHGHLTPALESDVAMADTMAALEDLYLPYRPKRRTRAAIAREKGLAPLARELFDQSGIDPRDAAADFVSTGRGVDSVDDALGGARDIIAEIINENGDARKSLRRLFLQHGMLLCRVVDGKEQTGSKYRDYFDWREPLAGAPSHRVLAMRRGEKEDVLALTIRPDEATALKVLTDMFLTGSGPDAGEVQLAIADAYQRLLSRSMETEARLASKTRADEEAIRVFADNLRHLLMAAPLGNKRVLAVDPGFRTGCKLACLDRQGNLLHHDTIYPHTSPKAVAAARSRFLDCCSRYRIEAVAVGNGTAGRETEKFARDALGDTALPVISVNESGASIYSASEIARTEFPDLDLTVRGAVSIGRRLMDPLSELVKIDPKSIGVGQYQHDVDQTALKQALDDIVISCVNGVGVDLNRASRSLLAYVSGIGNRLAANLVAYRRANGPFRSRKDLLKVPRLGPKAFEQAAGFLRIPDGSHPLDASAVHPESYPIVESMARDLGCSVVDLMASPDTRKRIRPDRYVSDTIGLPTLNDIVSELAKPGRDPRDTFEAFSFSDEVNAVEDLEEGMVLPGLVTNVTRFGAFVDIGVHQDGLVHISKLADRFVRDPSDVVHVGQQVQVTVLAVDTERQRIGLSMRSTPDGDLRREKPSRSRRRKDTRPAPSGKQEAPFHNPFAKLLKPGTDT